MGGRVGADDRHRDRLRADDARPAAARRRRRAAGHRQHLRDADGARRRRRARPRPRGVGAGARRSHHLGGEGARGRHLPERRAVRRGGGGLQHQPGHRSRLQFRAAQLLQHDRRSRGGRRDDAAHHHERPGPDPADAALLAEDGAAGGVGRGRLRREPGRLRPLQVRQLEPRLEHHPDRERRLLGRRARGRRGRVPLHPRVRDTALEPACRARST